jgi:hypothetical protein
VARDRPVSTLPTTSVIKRCGWIVLVVPAQARGDSQTASATPTASCTIISQAKTVSQRRWTASSADV